MRLLLAAKTLFARNGYEQTSTANITRSAGSSESQLIRYFGGKAGLLETIFNESWRSINQGVEQQLAEAQHGRDAIVRLLGLMIDAFTNDHEIAFLFLFEGRRVRGGSSPEVHLSEGFLQFMQVIGAQIHRGVEDGSFRRDIHPRILCSAMLGCAEGMIRDQILAERNHQDAPYDRESVLKTFAAMLGGLASEK